MNGSLVSIRKTRFNFTPAGSTTGPGPGFSLALRTAFAGRIMFYERARFNFGGLKRYRNLRLGAWSKCDSASGATLQIKAGSFGFVRLTHALRSG